MRQFLTRMSRKTLMIGGIVLGIVLLTGIGLAAAAAASHTAAPNTARSPSISPTSSPRPNPGKHVHLVQVTAVNGNTITVVPANESLQTTNQQPVTLTISSSTQITKYGQPAPASAIQVGEFLIVKSTDAQHVQQIDILGYGVRGVIQTISNGSLTLQTAQNQTVQVAVSNNTRILEGYLPVSLSDLQPNQTVEAFGDKTSNGSLNARLVHVDLIRGKVASINGDTIMLSTGNKGEQITVTTSAATKYYIAGQQVPASMLKVGDMVGVAGSGSPKTGIKAAAIFIHAPAVQGTVTTVNGDIITLKARDGATWTITVTNNTKYFQGNQPASLADVKVNSMIKAIGLQTGNNALTAMVVFIAAPTK